MISLLPYRVAISSQIPVSYGFLSAEQRVESARWEMADSLARCIMGMDKFKGPLQNENNDMCLSLELYVLTHDEIEALLVEAAEPERK